MRRQHDEEHKGNIGGGDRQQVHPVEDLYERLAGEAKPMFCYVQGMESLACLVEFDDRLEKIGVQSFPG